MSADRLEAIAAFSYLHEAEFARTSLESEGIVTVIENENLIRLDWLYMNAFDRTWKPGETEEVK